MVMLAQYRRTAQAFLVLATLALLVAELCFLLWQPCLHRALFVVILLLLLVLILSAA